MYIRKRISIIFNSSKTNRGGIKVTIQERIRMSLLLEEMKKNKEAAEKYGLKDVSTFQREYKENDDKHDYSLK